MAAVEIERLTLELPGLAPWQGHRLAELVARGLAQARWAPAQGADGLHVMVTPPAGAASLDELAALIVAELRRQTK
jgi:hypothetical protein